MELKGFFIENHYDVNCNHKKDGRLKLISRAHLLTIIAILGTKRFLQQHTLLYNCKKDKNMHKKTV